MIDFEDFVIDAGNTTLKIGLFKDSENIETLRINYSDFFSSDILKTISNKKGILSSVLTTEQTQELLSVLENCRLLNASLKLPIEIEYDSIQTLGKDRLCNVVAAWKLNTNNPSCVIDLGTCIKFDFVNSNGTYQGGSISPGLHLRYKSLNDYTGLLPLLSETNKTTLIGSSTKHSIHSGVLNGMQAEIQGFIDQYTQQFPQLTFFVTGGDSKYFDIHSKNNIFVVENLTLLGLYQILLLNDQ